MRLWLWPFVAALPLVAAGCGREPRPLDSGWWGTQPLAAAAAPRDSVPQARAAGVVLTSSAASGRRVPADAPPKVTLSGTMRAGSVHLTPTRHEPARRVPVPPPADLQASLLRLRFLQANLFAMGRAYTEAPDRMGYAPDAGADVRILWASNWGWAAMARDEERPYLVCTMYVGAVPHEGAAAGRVDDERAGVPNCVPSPETPGRWVAYPHLLLRDSARTSLGRGAATLMRHDLAKLVVSQRAHRAMQGVYAQRVDPMSLHYAWHPGVTLHVIAANADGWVAEATYDQWSGHNCVIWYGAVGEKPMTARDGRVAEVEGVPECDE